MPTITLAVTQGQGTPAPEEVPRSAGPLYRGTGDVDYVCGNCGFTIAATMKPGQRVLADRATCRACGAENEFPPELRP